jgi:S-adenosylmethionine:tRNA ribosyltransferase-isomerase
MKTDAFDFDLPPERIADRPARPRDAARLLVVDDTLTDRTVRDLPDYLRPGDVLVFNDTRVIPARLTGRRGAAKVEVTLHKHDGPGQWRAFARPAKRLRQGDTVDFAPGLSAEVAAKGDAGEVTLRFIQASGTTASGTMASATMDDASLMRALSLHGHMPLPPYIRRPEGAEPGDSADYQTIFAARDGAVAAPTAGLHFTPTLLEAVRDRGVTLVPVTLHVGAGTFLPVKVDDLRDHRMHSEWGEVTPVTADIVNRARAAGGRIVAAGTTALRILETATGEDGVLRPFAGETDIFITPGYRFRLVDMLLTNFHLPRSTLFMLVAAFAGLERMRGAYAHAIASRYRFFSYGDATLLRKMPSSGLSLAPKDGESVP